MLRTLLKYSIYIAALVFVVLLVYRQVLMSQIPPLRKTIPIKISRDEIPVPRRPGSQSIRIVGPPRKLLKFQIDFTRNPMPIDWRFLEQTDKRADIMVEGVIYANGNFTITRLRDRGHPKAGQYIRRVMSTWKFKQYKKGRIRYYFNVPSRREEMKVQIDLRRLEKNYKFIGPGERVKNGVLCYVDGIGSDNIMVMN